jgi:hypothetical protein
MVGDAKYFQVLGIGDAIMLNNLLLLQSCNPLYPFEKRLSFAIRVTYFEL